ncbi:MAG: metallophosphoesterase [Campylobacterota bacterium]|nr:metallophosphoesterase [Campylobacterota bacterium]
MGIKYLMIFTLGFTFLYLISRYYDALDQQLLYFSSYFIGIGFILFSVAVVYDLSTLLSKKIFSPSTKRKLFIDSAIILLLLAYISIGIFNGQSNPQIQTTNITIGVKTPLKIVQLSDVHIGNTIKKDFIENLVQTVNAQKPDLVVLTGDLIDLEIEKIKHDVAPLKDLKSTYGTYFILGNHEYFHHAKSIVAYLKTLGIKPLLNESVLINKQFNLVGLTDYIGYRTNYLAPDVKKAYAHVHPNYPTIVLAHQPKLLHELLEYKPNLLLSGHTHGGQIFPFGLLVLLDQPYLSGLHKQEQTQLYISRGTGYWGPPIRLFAPSEISVLNIQ